MRRAEGGAKLTWLFDQAEQWRTFWSDPLSRSGKAFVLGVILLGIPIILFSLIRCLLYDSWTWAWLAALSAGLASLSFGLGRLHEKIGLTLCDVLVFLAIFLQGPFAGVVVAAAEGAAFNLRASVEKRYRQLFNLAQIAIVSLFAGQVFYWTYGAATPLDRDSIASPLMLLLVAAACGLYYYLMTSGLVARAVAFSCHQRFDDIWIKCLGKAHLSSAGALLGALIFLTVA